MYALMKAGGVIAVSENPITYDEPHKGWQVDRMVYVDEAGVMSAVAPVSPPEFQLLFTVKERVAIKKRRLVDEELDAHFVILEDQRLTEVVTFLPEVVEGLESLTVAFTSEDGKTKFDPILDANRVNDVVHALPPGTTSAKLAASGAASS